jgi:hypothetical protein
MKEKGPMPGSGDFIDDAADGSETLLNPVSPLAVWHKPEISRVPLAATSRFRHRIIKRNASTDDFTSHSHH